MSKRLERQPFWELLNTGLWLAFFAVGLEPERFYSVLRQQAGVVTQEAWINSPHLVTLALAGYLAYFAWLRCIEAGMPPGAAHSRAVEIALFGLIGFLWYSPAMLLYVNEIPVADLRLVVWLVVPAKLFAWFYLFTVVMRYVLLGHTAAFADMPGLFPSSRVRRPGGERTSPPEEAGADVSAAEADRPRGE